MAQQKKNESGVRQSIYLLVDKKTGAITEPVPYLTREKARKVKEENEKIVQYNFTKEVR